MPDEAAAEPGERPTDLVAAARVLRAAQANVRVQRAAGVRDLELLLEWADLQSVDPQTQPGAVPAGKGGPKLIDVGGEGTPEVNDLELDEMAIARGTGYLATRNATADALDLRHRLPRLWAVTRNLECEPWLARKIASMTRQLSKDACAVVDASVVEAIGQGPRRVLAIAEAKIIEADRDAHRERLAKAAAKRGVWFPEPQPGEEIDEICGSAGLRTVYARLSTGEVVDLSARVDQIADLLAIHGDYDPDHPPTTAQLRADAFAMLADPAAVLAFFEICADSEVEQVATRQSRDHSTGRVVLNLHLSGLALDGIGSGVVRCEELGPILLDQVADLVGHRHVTVKPVIDLHHGRSVNGYEHPTDVRERTELRTLGSVFPHSTGRPAGRKDHDHPVPYDRDGPPGQTGDHNDAPLGRREHRAKTHLGYTVEQTGPGTYRWTTPHRLTRVVDGTGTHAA